MKKLLLIVSLLLSSTAAAQSTINPTVPAANSALASAPIRANFFAAYNDINNAVSSYAGAVAPVLPVLGQRWLNTGVTPYVLNQYDGSTWVQVGTLNASTHAYNGLGSPTAGQNLFYAGPSSGGTGAATFRALTTGDLPGSTTGTGSFVLQTSPTIITPNITGAILGGTPGYTSTGVNAMQFTGNANNFYQLSLQNLSSLSNASSDFVVTADTGNDNIHYADFGMNNSGGGGTPFTNALAAYVYSADAELDLGALGTSGKINFYAGGGTSSPSLIGYVGTNGLNSMAIGATTPSSATFTSLTSRSTETLGVSGTTAGQTIYNNATSGTITVQPTTGALGSAVITLPATTGTATILGNASTGTGAVVLAASPTLTGVPVLPNGTTFGGNALSLGGALTTSGAFSSTFTMTGTTALTFPTSGTVTALGNAATGSGSVVLATSPTLTTPVLGAASGTSVAVSGALTTGTSGSSAGSAIFNNATSGAITIQPPTGALGTRTLTLPLATGTLVTTGDTATVTGTMLATNTVALSNFVQQGANTVLANVTNGTANVAAFTMPSCTDTAGNHINYVQGAGFTCGTSSSGTTPAYVAASVSAVLVSSFGGIK